MAAKRHPPDLAEYQNNAKSATLMGDWLYGGTYEHCDRLPEPRKEVPTTVTSISVATGLAEHVTATVIGPGTLAPATEWAYYAEAGDRRRRWMSYLVRTRPSSAHCCARTSSSLAPGLPSPRSWTRRPQQRAPPQTLPCIRASTCRAHGRQSKLSAAPRGDVNYETEMV